jgi:hypothetical protein
MNIYGIVHSIIQIAERNGRLVASYLCEIGKVDTALVQTSWGPCLQTTKFKAGGTERRRKSNRRRFIDSASWKPAETLS